MNEITINEIKDFPDWLFFLKKILIKKTKSHES